jgi:hypothetical protein
MDHYRFYELDPSNRIRAGHSVECGSDTDAKRAAVTLLERAAGVEVWTGEQCLAHLTSEPLWDQLREEWMA